MERHYRLLRVRQLDRALATVVTDLRIPKAGWVRELRTALGITGRQLAARLKVTPPAIDDLETAEADGNVTIARLRRAAEALDCRLVYAFVPRQGSFDALLHERAEVVARRLVGEVEKTMALEDQRRSPETLREEIQSRAAELARNPGRALWNDT